MPMSRDMKIISGLYMRRKIVTFPFFIAMIVAIFPLFTNIFHFAKAHFVWSDTEAEIMVVSEDEISYFRYFNKKENTYHTGSLFRQKVLWCIPFGTAPYASESIKVAYNPSNPSEYLIYPKIYCGLLTWGIIEVVCFFLYFELEAKMKEHIRKTTNVRLTG